MARRRTRTPLVLLVLAAAAVLAALFVARHRVAPPREGTAVVPGTPWTTRDPATRDQVVRARIYAELQPVTLANCTLERLGEARDGGYLMCGNLLQAEVGYSYGISGYDGWGCAISTRLGVPVHQYDCFDHREPRCDGGRMHFHAECIGASASTDASGRPFDTLASQLTRNGDAERRAIVKMDVEGAEWDSLLATPPDVLARIDQLAIEMHGNEPDVWKQFLVVSKLKDQFHVAHLHFNNYGCRSDLEPFPSYAWEVLLVNKRLGVLAADQPPIRRPHPLDAANYPDGPDCQYGPADGGANERRP